MSDHYKNEHPGVQYTPVNLVMLALCGLCDYNYKNAADLNSHYNEMHVRGDIYSDVLLTSLNLDQIDVNQCKYASRCCNMITKQDQIDQIVNHVSECKRFAWNRIDEIQTDRIEKIIEIFSPLLSNMEIIMPNGLVVTMFEIAETTFAQKLNEKIGQAAHQLWQPEKNDPHRLTGVRCKLLK